MSEFLPESLQLSSSSIFLLVFGQMKKNPHRFFWKWIESVFGLVAEGYAVHVSWFIDGACRFY